MNPLKQLVEQGQAIWLDYIHRNLLSAGGLKRLVHEDGICGVTSNPTIFEKAIAHSGDYDDALRELIAQNPGAIGKHRVPDRAPRRSAHVFRLPEPSRWFRSMSWQYEANKALFAV